MNVEQPNRIPMSITKLEYPNEKASLHFCAECNNMLYPKADSQRRVMVFACRICDHDELSENKCVYRNDLLTVTKCVVVYFFVSCVLLPICVLIACGCGIPVPTGML